MKRVWRAIFMHFKGYIFKRRNRWVLLKCNTKHQLTCSQKKNTPNYTHVRNPIFDKRNSLTRNTSVELIHFKRDCYIMCVCYDFLMDLCWNSASRQIDRLSHTTSLPLDSSENSLLYGTWMIANLISETHSKEAYFYMKIIPRCFYSLNNVNAVSLSIFLLFTHSLFIFILSIMSIVYSI